MDTLSVNTIEGSRNSFTAKWEWYQHGAKQPLAGEVLVRLDESYLDDRRIIAELGSIHHLLEERHIHGSNRLGDGIKIEVSAGAIRKAVLKGSLKKSDKGDTEKKHVATVATFLATKYFEAEVKVWKNWKDKEPKSFEFSEITVPENFPWAGIRCHLLGEDVMITRHAMRRYIGRLNLDNPDKPEIPDENDLSHVPDKWWGTAWRWFNKIFQADSTLRRVNLLPKWHARYVRKYGHGSIYLWHQDSQGVIIVQRDRDSGHFVAKTVIHEKYANIKKDPVQCGQRLVHAG
jgi:hypothetical protein